MKSDLYTKAVLTVIAACLTWMCISGVTPVARAQTPKPPQPTPVILVDAKGVPLEALRVSLGQQFIPVVVSNAQPVPVAVNSTVAVAVRSLERGGRWDAIPVQVLREAPTLMPTP